MKKWASLFSLLLILALHQRARSLQSTTAIRGIAVDAKTKLPLQNVRVAAVPEIPPVYTISDVLQGIDMSPKSALTTNEGRFAIENAAPGRYRLEPQLAKYVFASPPHLKLPREPGVWIQVPAT